MKSIQTKFISLILGSVILCSVVIGGAGFFSVKKVIEVNSTQLMNKVCSEKALELDALLSRIEQSVKTLAIYTNDQLESVERLKNDVAYMEEYTNKIETVAVNAADNIEGAVAVYVRYNPEFTFPTSGLFWSKINKTGRFQQLTPTDFSSYDEFDIAHVGWYYLPVKSGKAIWMEPYQNENIDVHMISYVIPIYKGNETIGVVGMDIDFSIIEELVSNINVYDTGYAFLINNAGTVMFHKNIETSTSMESISTDLARVVNKFKTNSSENSLITYKYENHSKSLAFRSLKNGMRLAVSAPNSEIDRTKNNLLLLISVSVLVISCISVSLTIFLTHRLVRPLKELNNAAKKIVAGDLSISLTQSSRDEVGTLAESFQQTVNHLQKYIKYINGLAYQDPLTGVKNKAAYLDAENRINDDIQIASAMFSLIVLDINGLKIINDQYGHNVGDLLIIDACKIICDAFKHSPVYRIGGDEFVVILEGNDHLNSISLLELFNSSIDEHNQLNHVYGRLSVAYGIAKYNQETDLVYANVFKRADDAMYLNKAMTKQQEK